MRLRQRLGFVATGIAVTVTACTVPPGDGGSADMVLRNGFVWTVDARDSQQQAIAIRGGKIVYVGSDDGVRKWVGDGTTVIDLHGKMVMPGIQDTHTHTLRGGAQLAGCSLDHAPLTVIRFQERVQSCLDTNTDKEPDATLTVGAWNRGAMQPAGTTVDRTVLDALHTGRPIVVTSADGHASLVNSAALNKAGITAATPDPASGRIDRDSVGNPTGILEDDAANLVKRLIPRPTPEAPGISVTNVGELILDGVWETQRASMLTPYYVNKGTADKPDWVPGTNRGPNPFYSKEALANVTSPAVAVGR
jgi:predicted amidohydrolase YtcJ